MGCDIHLRIEKRKRVNSYTNGRHKWYSVGFHGEFSYRIYGMFARIAKVKDYYNDKCKVQFKPHGLPDDMNYQSTESFYLYVTDNEVAVNWGEHYCLKKMAEKWVKEGCLEWIDENHTRITDPDLHSYSWLTTQELRQCFDDCFKQEDGMYKPNSDYSEWLGLVSLCEGIESDGIHECRVVFAFDN